MSSVPCMRSPCFSISAPIMYLGESRTSPLNAQGECFSVVGRQFVFGAAAVAADLVAYAANSSNAGGKFGKGKRFCDVIVRSGIEPADALLHDAGIRHDDYGQIRPFAPNPAQDFQPLASRQIEIEEHEIIVLVGSQLLRLRP